MLKSFVQFKWQALSLTVIVALLALAITSFPQEPPPPHDYTLPNDNFSQGTIHQIYQDMHQYNVAETPADYEMYIPTGGLGVADPQIMRWGSDGEMVFGMNDAPGTMWTIREYGQSPLSWHNVHWILHHTIAGQVYYELSDKSQAKQFFFQEGHTYIWVMGCPQNGAFPAGLMTHMKALGNPVQND